MINQNACIISSSARAEKQIIRQEKRRFIMNRLQIAQYIALGATALSVIGGLLGGLSGSSVGTVLMCVGFVAGLISYIFGGLGTAIKMAGGIAKWGWIVVPFPYDIMTFIMSFIFAIFAFVFLPIIPVRKAYKESMR